MAVSVKGAHFPHEILLPSIRWYVANPPSTRPVEALLRERGVVGPENLLQVENAWLQDRALTPLVAHSGDACRLLQPPCVRFPAQAPAPAGSKGYPSPKTDAFARGDSKPRRSAARA